MPKSKTKKSTPVKSKKQNARPRTKVAPVNAKKTDILFEGRSGRYLHVDQTTGQITERVPTPGGLRRASDVHTIEPMSRLVKKNGNVEQLKSDGSLIEKTAVVTAPPPILQPKAGWVVDACWFNQGKTPITSFSATFTVPPPPAEQNDQIIYLFVSVERPQGDDILQPVLQWAPFTDGTRCWSIASTWINSANQSFVTAPVKVEPGQLVTGVITLDSANDGTLNYTCQFEGFDDTKVAVGTSGEIGSELWCTVTLECYNIRFPNKDYPNTTKSVVSHINVQNQTGFPTVQWTVQDENAMNGETIKIITDGAQNALMEIVYQS